MPKLLRIRLFPFALIVAMCCPALLAQQKSNERTYVITLKPAVANASDVATDLARLYGGTAEPNPDEAEGAVRMRLTRARARVLAADPRVASVTATAVLQANAVTEAVSWSAGVSYAYDGSGNVHKVGSDTFSYDHAGRLITASVNGTPRDYSYDGFGNRTGCVQWANTSSQAECQKSKTIDVAGNRNRLKDVPYDNAGNATALDGHQYAYDALNMMKRDTLGTQAREFVYTAEDERIAVYNAGSSWRWSIRDQSGKVLREFTSSNGPNGAGTASWQWARDNVFRDGQLLASRQPENQSTTTYFYHLDHLGTPRRITDTNDRIVGSHDYFAFGPEISGGTSEASATALKYTGQERDTWGGLFGTLDYMHARYDDPELGRFLSVDPAPDSADLEAPQSWNRYAYARNSPLARLDPDGRRDVYVAFWTAEFPYFVGRGSVGHAAMFEVSGKTIVSQFPDPHGAHGKNTTLTYGETLIKENGRLPDNVFLVHLPYDADLDAARDAARATKWWDADPSASDNETHCSAAVYSVMRAGGANMLSIGFGAPLPYDLRKLLEDMAEKDKKKAQPDVKEVPPDTLQKTPDKYKK
ncbi:MAG: hypothetical protein DMF56_19705 [Acidobacteria bacterium]|nr:MAG: hypothetical protein DMF56_19705 [Acidobacteriota bacterium]